MSVSKPAPTKQRKTKRSEILTDFNVTLETEAVSDKKATNGHPKLARNIRNKAPKVSKFAGGDQSSTLLPVPVKSDEIDLSLVKIEKLSDVTNSQEPIAKIARMSATKGRPKSAKKIGSKAPKDSKFAGKDKPSSILKRQFLKIEKLCEATNSQEPPAKIARFSATKGRPKSAKNTENKEPKVSTFASKGQQASADKTAMIGKRVSTRSKK